ncbi:MAG TPA: hypothetical protein VNS32_20350 [Flavisolibacter sp.]|nr:hypothetical protein [Flavisolibacter sp.]
MKKFAYLMLLSAALWSCTSTRYSYNPAAFYNPVFNEKGQSNVIARYSTGPSDESSGLGSRNDGMDVSAAYAISKRFSIAATYYFRNEKDSYLNSWFLTPDGSHAEDSSIVNYNRKMFQIGAGYTIPFKNQKSSFSVFAFTGVAANRMNDRGLNDNTPYSNYHNFNSYQFSVQPAVNFGLSSNITSSIISRVTYAHNYNIKTDYDGVFLYDAGLANINDLFYLALGYNMRVSFNTIPWLKLEGQFMISGSGQTTNTKHYARGSSSSVGVSIDLKELMKKN